MKEKLKKEDIGFTQVKNDVLNDKNLSWKAKGLFAYLFSKPDDWDFSGERICLDSSDGRLSTYSGIKELEQSGYLVRMKTKSGKMVYCLYWSKKPIVGFRKVRKPQSAETDSISNKDNIQIKNNKNIYIKIKKQTYKSKQKIYAQKALKPKKTPRTTKQDETFKALAIIGYYRDRANELHGMQFFRVKDENRNKAVRKLIIRAGKEVNLKSLIDWWLDGAGEWANYEPEACFSTRSIEKFINKDKKRKPKLITLK